jgi:hypothetical protein
MALDWYYSHLSLESAALLVLHLTQESLVKNIDIVSETSAHSGQGITGIPTTPGYL